MDVERLTQLKKGEISAQPSWWVVEQIEDFVTGKTATFDALLLEEDFNKTLDFLRVKKFNGSDVLGYYVRNTMSNYAIESSEQANSSLIGSDLTVSDVIERLIDMQSGMNDFENDVRLAFALKYDGDTVLIIGKRVEECPVHCADCQKNINGFDENGIHITNEYSCSHADGAYEYINNYWMGMVKQDEFEDQPDWVDWETNGLATDDPQPEKPLGLVEKYALWQAEVGDVIVASASEQGGPDAKIYTYEFTVKSAGEQPLTSLRQINPDGTIVEEEGVEVALKGTGWWGDYRTNPMVKSADKEISIDVGTLHAGNYLVIQDPLTNTIYELRPAVKEIVIKKAQDDAEWETAQPLAL